LAMLWKAFLKLWIVGGWLKKPILWVKCWSRYIWSVSSGQLIH